MLRGELALQQLGARLRRERAYLNRELPPAKVGLRRRDYGEANLGGAGANKFDVPGGGAREIDDAAFDEGPSIGDADIGFLLRREETNAHPCLEWKRWMSGGELLHVEDLTIGCATSVIGFAIPACDAFFRGSDARDGQPHGIAASSARSQQCDQNESDERWNFHGVS